MSSLQQVSEYFAVYILHYCWQREDAAKYSLNLKRVCKITRSDDEYGSKQICDWKMAYMPPNIEHFQTIALRHVLLWYRLTYELPEYILHNNTGCLPQITQDEMENISHTDFSEGCAPIVSVLNTTKQSLYFFNKQSECWENMHF